MKKNGTHEGCIEQMTRLFSDKLKAGSAVTDEGGMIRLDDLEMKADIQAEVKKLWDEVTTENVKELADIDGYWSDFFALFGFGADGINYDAETDPVYDIASLK
jgi:enoyl-[acyl-carrier protein] reductase/trans-2-enoyl-CoA reductase (NAD+)